MLFEIKELAKHVWISAFDTKPDVEQILGAMREKAPGVSVQLVDLDKVAGSRYLLLATYNALKSFQSKQPIARTLAMEMLLYIAANKQIGEALGQVGVNPDTRRVAAVVVSDSREQLLEAAGVLAELVMKESVDALVDEWSPKRVRNVRSLLDIGDKELKATIQKDETTYTALERLAIERSALLAIKK